ncbi:tripartite tricarboxylate transporter permease [Bordetella bronchiseptica]|uniref:tripartite tricarboxylate transporter permease n=1 Tax=Bordetella bronchiseptica TaxID=518 RepID=UPI000290787B|nr:tripartite tricarboxylate transporter permease [Bordetella bronchiseptica]KAB1448557.1 tripartite tricarboxylate transporter permease [Bordetella bronchiseptica]KAB1574879.1 tripartite tricarboxylate transporter permease [Bordetella bronchiseptica]CCN21164.1 putative membrane protein [Bordetella bronchiseptica 1289]
MELFDNIMLGLSTALAWNNLLWCIIGVSLGTLIGVIPGVGTLATMSLLFPITYVLEPTAALIMLAGIWYGSTYGGSTASILLNLPGTPANAVTCLDGFPMAKQGRGGVALLMTTVASFFGASVGIVMMMLFSPLVAEVAFKFGPAEYFSIMALGLVAASVVSSGSAIKGITMVVGGVMLGLVGTDVNSGVARFDFGFPELQDGVQIVALAMGLFGVTEIIASINHVKAADRKIDVSMKAMLPTRDEMKRSWGPMARGSGLGSFFGVLPGVGPTVAAFMAYALEKRTSKTPERFGRGAIEGIMAPESANNASDQASFIPTMTLGIPGSVTMALIIGALMIHGIQPGPQMLTEQPEMFWGLVMSFWIGNIVLVILNVPMIGLWVRVLTIPYHVLYPAIVMFICIGTYAVNNNVFDVYAVLVFGIAGYVLRVLGFEPAPLLLGYVLGPMLEENFRRAMLLSRGSLQTFIERPISMWVLLLTVFLLAWGMWSSLRQRPAARMAPASGST